jgi:hypothetical protein
MPSIASATERLPSRRQHSFTCFHCGAYAAQEWRALGYLIAPHDEEPYFVLAESTSQPSTAPGSPWSTAPTMDVWEETPMIVDSTWAQSECHGCSQVATWRGESVVYPNTSSAPFPHADMPETVLPLHEEARSIVNHSRRGAAALARATMELLLRELDPEAPRGARLDDRILRVENKVSSGLAELLTFIRHVGNQSLHVTGAPDDAVVLVLNPDHSEPVEAIFEAINELVDELKTKPERNSRLSALVPATVREAIDRKRQAQQAAVGNQSS